MFISHTKTFLTCCHVQKWGYFQISYLLRNITVWQYSTVHVLYITGRLSKDGQIYSNILQTIKMYIIIHNAYLLMIQYALIAYMSLHYILYQKSDQVWCVGWPIISNTLICTDVKPHSFIFTVCRTFEYLRVRTGYLVSLFNSR